MIRDGLKMLIQAQPDMECVGEADDGSMAVGLASKLQPDVVVMDITMPELNGLLATEKLKQEFPNIKVLTLTRHKDESHLQQILRAGASGYVLKQSAASALIQAIRAVAAGHTWLDPAVTESVVSVFIGKQPAADAPINAGLSERESETLRLIAWGYSNKEVAAQLKISVKTVESHKAKAMQKLGLNSRIDIVRFALLQGWLQET
jgi:DNA-binding NarL/FixJ family response regulator